MYLRPSVLRCWRALLLTLCVLPFCNLFPHTYIRRFHICTYFLSAISFRIRTYGDSTYVRTYFLSAISFHMRTYGDSIYVQTPTPHPYYDSVPLHKHQIYIRPIFHNWPKITRPHPPPLLPLCLTAVSYNTKHCCCRCDSDTRQQQQSSSAEGVLTPADHPLLLWLKDHRSKSYSTCYRYI